MYKSASIVAQNTFTDPLPVKNYANFSISGTWVGTVFLQRSFNGGSTWLDVASYTANTEKSIVDEEPGVFYRLGIKTGGYTSGTAVLRISTAER